MTSTSQDVATPCIGVCMLDAEGLCMGCHRSSDEIARWLRMGEAERSRLMEQVLPQRGERRNR